jgi:hypothetical protein
MRFLQHLRSLVHRIKEMISPPPHIALHPYRPHCPLCLSQHVSNVYTGRINLLSHNVDQSECTCLDCGTQWHEDYVTRTQEIVRSRVQSQGKAQGKLALVSIAQAPESPSQTPAQAQTKPLITSGSQQPTIPRNRSTTISQTRFILPPQGSTKRPSLPPLREVLQGRKPPQSKPYLSEAFSDEIARKRALAQLEAIAQSQQKTSSPNP